MITASFRPSFALSRPATSDHLTSGFSETIALDSESCSFLSGSSPSPFAFGGAVAEAPPAAPPPPPPYGGAVGAT